MGTKESAFLSFLPWGWDALAELKSSHQILRREHWTALGQKFEAGHTRVTERAHACSEPRRRAGGTGPGRQVLPRRAVPGPGALL